MEFQSKAIVATVSDEVRTKENGATFVKCTVKHIDGPLAGKTFFANRTLKNAQGEEKSTVKPGDEILCYNRVVDNQIYSDISTGTAVDNLADLLALVNKTTVESPAEAAQQL
jgi:hypothetical protein